MTRNRDRAADAFSNHEPCHERGTVFTDGHTIWSYSTRFPMAFWTADGELWVNEDTYSVTTSGHQSALRARLAADGWVPGQLTGEITHGSADPYTFRRWNPRNCPTCELPMPRPYNGECWSCNRERRLAAQCEEIA